MEKFKVALLYSCYALVFALVFCSMLVMLTIAAAGVPAGLMLFVFGVAMLLFKADFILTDFAPQFILFGGACAAFVSAFLGLCAVKAGFMVSRLFLKIKRRCDHIRNW